MASKDQLIKRVQDRLAIDLQDRFLSKAEFESPQGLLPLLVVEPRPPAASEQKRISDLYYSIDSELLNAFLDKLCEYKNIGIHFGILNAFNRLFQIKSQKFLDSVRAKVTRISQRQNTGLILYNSLNSFSNDGRITLQDFKSAYHDFKRTSVSDEEQSGLIAGINTFWEEKISTRLPIEKSAAFYLNQSTKGLNQKREKITRTDKETLKGKPFDATLQSRRLVAQLRLINDNSLPNEIDPAPTNVGQVVERGPTEEPQSPPPPAPPDGPSETQNEEIRPKEFKTSEELSVFIREVFKKMNVFSIKMKNFMKSVKITPVHQADQVRKQAESLKAELEGFEKEIIAGISGVMGTPSNNSGKDFIGGVDDSLFNKPIIDPTTKNKFANKTAYMLKLISFIRNIRSWLQGITFVLLTSKQPTASPSTPHMQGTTNKGQKTSTHSSKHHKSQASRNGDSQKKCDPTLDSNCKEN